MTKVFKPISSTMKAGIIKGILPKIDFFSGLLQYGKRIIQKGNANGVQKTTVYTVPEGKWCFITFISFAGQNAVAEPQDFIAYVNDVDLIDIISAKLAPVTVVLPFPLPLILTSGEKIKIETFHASSGSQISILGYEIDINLIPLFI